MAFDSKLTTTIGRTAESLFGDRLGALTFGLKGDGTTDDAPALNAAIVDCHSIGGRAIYFPAGYVFLLKTPVTLLSNVWLIGEGYGSQFLRGADMPAGQGVFNITGANCGLRNVSIDGDVTATTGLQYGGSTTLPQFGNDPMSDTLTQNTSIWIHENSGGITIEDVTIEHTGGYAILLDARTGDIADVRILRSTFQNNRPHAFGTTLGDLTYGSWTGGIHYQGHCVSPALSTVQGLLVDGCSFARNAGNQVWGHAYGFEAMHSQIRVTHNAFLDIGLDCIQSAVTAGGIVSGNTGRRIGYMCSDDTSASVPKWSSAYAVFLDTSGTTGVSYIGNSAVSVLGGFIDLDGFSHGIVAGNVGRVPQSGEPEYAEDLISTWPSDVAYGVQTANNYYEPGGRNVAITGNTFLNFAAGAIRLFSARGCHVSGNTINHPAAAAFAPVILGNFNPASGGPTVHSVDNDITANNIQWAPATAKGAVQELEDWGVGSIPWSAGEVNWTADNRIFGANTYEFDRAPSSSSITGSVISSQGSGLTAGAHVLLSREQSGSTDYTSMYGPTGDLQWRFLDSIGQFNASVNGVGGSLTTGVRLGALGVSDTVATGHLSADGFLLLTDSTYAGSDADVFNGNYGLIRFDSGAGVFRASIGVSAGHRVWTTLATGSGVAGSDKQVQFNDGGTLAANSGFTFDKTTHVVTASGGFVGPVFNSSATGSANAVQQSSGTFTITGAGDAAFQSVAATNNVTAANVVISGTFNSTATGATSVIQDSAGHFTITGAGNAAFQDCSANTMSVGGQTVASQSYVTGLGYVSAVSATGCTASIAGHTLSITVSGTSSPGGSNTQIQFNNSGAFAGSSGLTWSGSQVNVSGSVAISGTFNSTATGTTSVIQDAAGHFTIKANGDAAFQTVAATSGMTIGSNAVATQSWVTSQGFSTSSGIDGVKTSDGAAYSNAGGYAFLSFINSSGFINTSAISVSGTCEAANFSISGTSGWSGSFVDNGGNTHNVSHGIITS